MNAQVLEIAERIRGMRRIMELSEQEMAEATGVTLEEYRKAEHGETDFSFTFLYKCAKKFHVDIVELLTGETPKLSLYSVVRKGQGLPLERRQGFKYNHLASFFKNKTAEPFYVAAPYREEEQNAPIHLSSHKGEEFDYIIKGSLKFQLEDHVEILQEGDAVYYNSGHGHGMIATGGQDCEFLAVVIDGEEDDKK